MTALKFPETLTNRELAATLFNIATLLRDRQDNPYRIRAYENGARALMGRRDDVVATLRDGTGPLRRRKGILGAHLQLKLQELARTGRLEYLASLCADLPPYIGALMSVPGIGPRLAKRLHEVLGVETPEQLAEAARSGRVRSVYGVGDKRAEQWAQLSLFESM
jgi:DNA polymerase (family 10)